LARTHWTCGDPSSSTTSTPDHPGGESTTIGKLAERYGFIPKLRERIADGMPVWGRARGAIFIAKDVPGHPHPSVRRWTSASSATPSAASRTLRGGSRSCATSGRAVSRGVHPRAEDHEDRSDVETIAALDDGTVVAARQGNLLATSFHPELTPDDRFHRYFLSLGKK
jgi:5'-phosphate synthase pdxT subunit